MGYRVEYKAFNRDKEWVPAVDLSDNASDMLHDYREIPACAAQAVRLVITRNAYPGELGVIDFTVFGESSGREVIEVVEKEAFSLDRGDV